MERLVPPSGAFPSPPLLRTSVPPFVERSETHLREPKVMNFDFKDNQIALREKLKDLFRPFSFEG